MQTYYSMKKLNKFIFSFIALAGCSISTIEAQIPFDQKATTTGNIGISFSNVGTVGRPQVINNSQGLPSMEYPKGSGINHLFEGGIWIGAKVNGQIRVSTSADDASSGYRAGIDGFEFTPSSLLRERSSLANNENYSNVAVSHQDFLMSFTDRNVIIPGTTTPIANHQTPLFADIDLETYAWNFAFADYFVLMNYKITNNSNETWDSVWIGQWNDLVIRNLNVTQDGGAAFFNKGGAGFIDSNQTLYVYQVNGDDIDYTQSYGAVRILGVDWRGEFIHPLNSANLVSKGYPAPSVNPNFWIFGFSTVNDFIAPIDDAAKYERLKTGMNVNNPTINNQLRVGSNLIQLISIGPIPEVKPGESISFHIAYLAAKQVNGPDDTPEARENLYRNTGWAWRTFLGEDENANGVLDDGEDINENGSLNRYFLPEPPETPRVKIIPSSNKVEIYWTANSVASVDPISKKQDFEGFKLYRTNPGDDLKLNLLNSAKLVAQWDSAGNAIGYNNGFEAIKLDNPVYFDGDTNAYVFKYEMTGLLNGWQYLFVLTAFDKGDTELGLESLESSFTENDFRVYTGTTPNAIDSKNQSTQIGVYPNPYKTTAAWDGNTSRTRKIYFYNLPSRCVINIYTISGDLVATLNHNSATYKGENIRWFENFSAQENVVFSGGEHAWDLLSDTKSDIQPGTYLVSVKDLKTNQVQTTKFVILK